MNTFNKISIALLMLLVNNVNGQDGVSTEKYGNALNIGVGLGYYGYVGYSIPVVHVDYEIQISRIVTIAPSISFYNYHNEHYWGGNSKNYKYYKYKQTVIPIGLKGSIYFDQLLKANSKWDFYMAGSLGIVFRRTTWEDEYYGETNIHPGAGQLYVDLHFGTEYHLNNKIGLQLDLSTGVSTFGLAIHL